ncbi:helix-turn-helix domain-containing protein [Desulfonatronum thiodismutans]|uniref:helix-turn-helix domain-containing protein n=1 Tax=Desulfonatronum thiodismutans TaxID=159290 RepID=UPI001376A013|nr:AraC family transcriptional regulator [Desulfonatronum thiodismutans]
MFAETATVNGCRGERLRLELPQGKGRGWMEMIQIDRGLGVGMCDYLLEAPFESRYNDVSLRLGFHVLLSGGFEFAVPEMDFRENVQGRELWLHKGRVGEIRYMQPAGCVMRGLSIELPSAMVDAWLDGAPGELGRALEAMIQGTHQACGQTGRVFSPLIQAVPGTSSIVRSASRLLAMPRDTVCDQLRFESLVLELLARILSFDFPSWQGRARSTARRREAVDEAVDILCAEWADPPTISALARRVGLNECYLKAGFRNRTGLSIGEYVRKLRMEHALELIESGKCSILQVALAVGYSNPSHFSAAFKRFHGRLPSCCTPKS